MNNKIDAGHIAKLLANKHCDDVFVDQCKDGPTIGGLKVLDAWVMKKSWSHECMIGYEIKISRQDFLHDIKWPGYLKLCNELVFVCPWDIIHINEVPADCGLMWVSKSGTMITTKKKAPYRRIDEPVDLLKYLLMARATIDVKYAKLSHGNGFTKEFWDDWLANKEKDFKFGRNLGKSLRQEIKKKILDVETENRQLQARINDYNGLARVLKELGFNTKDFSVYSVEKKMRELKAAVPPSLFNEITCLERSLQNLRDSLEQLGVKI